MSIAQGNMSLKNQLVVGFQNIAFGKTTGFLVPKFWLVSNKDEYMEMLNYICNIDMIGHPEIKSFPAIFELSNNNGPILKEVSEVYFKECLLEQKKTAKEYEDLYYQKFLNKNQ